VNETEIEIDKEKIEKINQCDGNGNVKVNEEERQSMKKETTNLRKKKILELLMEFKKKFENFKNSAIINEAIIKPAGKNVKNKVRKIILNYCSY